MSFKSVFMSAKYRKFINYCQFYRKMSGITPSKKFYEEILQKLENDDTITIKKMELEPACEKGSSYMSDVKRVKLFGSRTLKTNQAYFKSLIIKELPSQEQRELYRSEIAVENENVAYTKILPALKRHAAEDLPLPNCLFANNEIIVLEDLNSYGFKPIDKSLGGLTVEECKVVLEGLAKLHAASFVLQKKEPETFRELSIAVKELLFEGGDSMLLNYQTDYIENTIQSIKKLPISEDQQKALTLLNDLKENSRARIKKLLLNPPENSVLCHGDAWIGNIMFNENNKVILLDLQLMRCGSVARDLSYLLYVNLLPEVRIKNMDALLNLYLNNLCKNIKKKNINMDSILTMDWLNNEMDKFKEYGLICGMWVMPVFYINKENVEITKKNLSDTSNIAKRAGSACEQRTRDLIFGYIQQL